MALWLLAVHLQTQHGKSTGRRRHWGTTPPVREPCTYRMMFSTVGRPRNCPVEGCRVQTTTRTSIRVHLFQRHVRDTVIILEEGNLLHPRCPGCNMLVPWRVLNRRHLSTAQYAKVVERKRQRMAEEEILESEERALKAYRRLLETVTSFKYLGRVLMAGDGDWPAAMGNLKKARKSWAQLTRILVREGSNPRVYGMLFKEVVQAVSIFGLETWVLTPHMEQALGSFQYRVARQITGAQMRRWDEGGWNYPPLATAMEEAGFEEIGTYILKMQNTVA